MDGDEDGAADANDGSVQRDITPAAGSVSTPFDEIIVGSQPGGIVAIQGPAAAVERFVDRVERTFGSPQTSRLIQAASVLGSSIDAIPGVGEDAASPAEMQLSKRAIEALRANDVLAAG